LGTGKRTAYCLLLLGAEGKGQRAEGKGQRLEVKRLRG